MKDEKRKFWFCPAIFTDNPIKWGDHHHARWPRFGGPFFSFVKERRYFVRQISFWNLRMNDALRLFSILLSLLKFKISFNSWVKAKFNFDCCLMKWFVLGVIEDQFFSFPWEFIPFIMRINRMERTQYSLFVFLYVKFKAKTDIQLLSKDFSYYIQRRNLQMGGQKVAER